MERAQRNVEVLRLVLTDIENERDRLRSARASFTARLGPLPAATGIVAAAVGEVELEWLAASGFVFLGLFTVSVLFVGLTPYRKLRSKKLDSGNEEGESVVFRRQETVLANWLEQKIRLEEEIYGDPGEERPRIWPTRDPQSLTEALNSERAAAHLVEVLSLVIFVLLLIGVAD